MTVNCAGDLFRAPWRRHSRPLDDADGLTAPEREESGVLDAVLSLPERYRAVCTLQYWYIPIGSEDTAGPGHWLEQLPE
ncbi:hypothetical protein [Clostridium sp. J1101437_171009_A5]|uniref:hypothetical protein n=1 Tax=Clostridium sp. J1101437_171009_A5 TaxID=2787098 RepID=UPI00189BBF53|nr:hypothetical protein [Clostridium sp. J1101437_171009_A5]